MQELDSLFVSGKEVDEGLLVQILSPFLKIHQESGAIIPDERWLKTTNEIKVILFLVARKAITLRGLPIDNEGVFPAEIEKETGIKGASIRPVLKRLFDEKTISQAQDGRYFVPNYSLGKISAMVQTLLKEKQNEHK